MELAEVSEVQDAPRSRRTVLDSRTRADGTTFELDHLTPGWARRQERVMGAVSRPSRKPARCSKCGQHDPLRTLPAP